MLSQSRMPRKLLDLTASTYFLRASSFTKRLGCEITSFWPLRSTFFFESKGLEPELCNRFLRAIARSRKRIPLSGEPKSPDTDNQAPYGIGD